jgi:Ser/Thr protein kinase RdoA (MazF antagonist)
MSSDVQIALASITNDYEVRRELHAVPPHAVYEVRIGGTRAVCKVARGARADPATEARVVEYVGRETSVPVPAILAVGEDFFVAEWRDGLPDDDPELDAERARAMGAGLATLHEETAGAFDATGFPRAEGGERREGGTLAVETHDSWAETVCGLLADRRDYLTDFGYEEVAETARAFVREHPTLFDEAGDPCGGVGDPVLAHGNYLPDHVGVADGEVSCVIDWEHALVAPAEYDYWRTAMPLFGGPSGAGEEKREAFREGYESVRPLSRRLDDRTDLYRLMNGVSYLVALHLQRQKTGQEKARHSVALRRAVFDAIEGLREQVE